jgi:hypothetical protein
MQQKMLPATEPTTVRGVGFAVTDEKGRGIGKTVRENRKKRQTRQSQSA